MEGTAKLAISALQKAGGLRPGACTIWRWSRGGDTFASIGVHRECEGVRLSYSISPEGGPSRRVEELVALVHRPCPYGGARALFLCPRCARAVLNLHLHASRFTCRSCAGLTYASRREHERDRNLRAANKLRRGLGGEEGAQNSIPGRPKGMWRRTYARTAAEIERREGAAMEELAGWLLRSGRGRTKGFWR